MTQKITLSTSKDQDELDINKMALGDVGIVTYLPAGWYGLKLGDVFVKAHTSLVWLGKALHSFENDYKNLKVRALMKGETVTIEATS